MHLFSNGPCLQTLLQSTTVIQTPETAQHGSSRALPGHRRQSSDDNHDYLIPSDLSTTSCSVSVADRRQADHDGLGHWTSACRTTLADTGALDMDPERAADVASSLETLPSLHHGFFCLDETPKQRFDWNLRPSLPSLEQNSPPDHPCIYTSGHSPGESFSAETYSLPFMASIQSGGVRFNDLAAHLARTHVLQDEKIFVLTCGNNKGFARRYDRTRHWSPVGLTASPLPKDASRDPQMATSEVAAANLTAQIVHMYVFTIIRAVAGAVLLAQDIKPHECIHTSGTMSSNHLVRV
ncbi:hypothetical protein F5X68DRAFT_20497 [Plectosphaerella plurivora]|uniref:Uncharacterized protein n=1 Tax=Plectosphaerella plurivora TaxID=936078 RepID=A0A9P9A7I6_9PEZI|nr:hypothetical protein F5X68DRAFT_20497 [Plectosphaerella plurivora]